jgi:Phytanoyl-CoA dioxygenase (PhyH)
MVDRQLVLEETVMLKVAHHSASAEGRAHDDIRDYPVNGYATLGTVLDLAECKKLRDYIDKHRPVNKDIFYASKAEFEARGRWQNYAPGRTDHNFLLSDEIDLSFIEKNPNFAAFMRQLCGADYQIFKKAIIRSMPQWAIPDWCVEAVADVGRPNMNPYIRDEFKDVQYFFYTDFHQDKTRPQSDFVTVYVYLDAVDEKYSALKILTKSHVLGMTTYPHSIRASDCKAGHYYYSDNIGNSIECELRTATGDAGSINIFHCMTLHGTGFNNSDNPRISLRYLISKSKDNTETTLQDEANKKIIGPRAIYPNRLDINPDGSFMKTGSSIMSLGLS